MVATSGSSADETSSLNKIPKLKGKDEFIIWSSDFEYFLRIKELWTLVTGEEPVIEPFTEEELAEGNLTDRQLRSREKKVKEYKKKVATVWYIFRQALSPDYLSILQLTPEGDAEQLWANLKSNFGQSNTTANKLSLLDKFNSIKMEDASPGNFRDSFNKACAQIEKICSDLADFNAPIQDDMKLGKIFTLVRGLNVEIDTFAANLIRMEDIDWTKAYNQLNDRFRELDIAASISSTAVPKKKGKGSNAEPTAENVANLVKNLKSFARKFKKSFHSNRGKKGGSDNGGGNGRFRGKGKKRQDEDHGEDKEHPKKNDGAGKKKRDLKHIQCHKCKEYGHYQSDCPQAESHAAIDGMTGDEDLMQLLNEDHRAFQQEQSMALVTTTADVNLAAARSEEAMIMDSGSNRTHVQRKQLLVDYSPQHSSVTVASGEKVNTHGIGKLGNLEASHTELTSNLLSIGQLCDAGYEVVFTKTHAKVNNPKTKRTVCRGLRHQGLYFIGTKDVSKIPVPSTDGGGFAMVASTKPLKSIDTWHARTHLSDDSIVKAAKLVDGVTLTKADLYLNPSMCETCAKCKIKRRQFKKSSHRPHPSGLFKLVSTDLGGPITPMGKGGANYMMVFVDEYSRYKYLYFLSTKDEAVEKLRHFRSQQVEAYSFKLCELLTDGGGEFTGEFEDFCIDSAIVHKTTSPYTPEENSTTEVYWRTLMEMVRSFLKASGLPASLWPFAAKHANFVLNRMLTVTIGQETKTPYEWRFGLRPNLKHLRVWGCPVIYKVHGHVRKLSDRGRDGHYLGTDVNSRSALILDKETSKVVKSGHVLFNEVIQRRMEVDSAESSESVRAWSLQRGEREHTVIEEVTDFDLTDQDRGEDGLFNSTRLESEDSGLEEDEDGILSGDSRFADEEPEEEYWPTEKRQRTESFKSTRSGVSFAAILSGDSAESELFTPFTYAEAVTCAEAKKWVDSIADEYAALEANNTWELAVLPDKFKPLDSKWVFRLKMLSARKIDRHKSRLTIKGFIQRHGVDYWETFSPVAKLISLRVFFALAAHLDMHLFQMDVNNAFLNADLKEEIYMKLPEGYDLETHLSGLPSDHVLRTAPRFRIVLRLNKALYGLKQAPREWYLNVTKFIKDKLGYTQLDGDSCLFVRRIGDVISLLALYVDDMVLACTCTITLQSDIKEFNDEYKMKNIGEPQVIVGLNVTRDKEAGTIKLSQQKYVHELVEKFGIKDKKVATTAADYGLPLTKEQCPTTDKEKSEMMKYPYREVVGSLMYLSVGTRPDISFAVSELSKFLANPGLAHWNAAVRVLRYLKGCPDLGVTFTRSAGNKPILRAYSDVNYKGPSRRQQQSQLKLDAYSDADWGGDRDTRRSHTGGVLFLAGGAIAWISKKQSSVAMSSAEAEYMAASLVCREVIWIRSILDGFGFQQKGPTVIHEDNEACIQMSKNPVNHSKAKHIDLHYHFVRERVESGEVRLDWVSTSEMIADMLTKAVTPAVFKTLRNALFNYHKRR